MAEKKDEQGKPGEADKTDEVKAAEKKSEEKRTAADEYELRQHGV